MDHWRCVLIAQNRSKFEHKYSLLWVVGGQKNLDGNDSECLKDRWSTSFFLLFIPSLFLVRYKPCDLKFFSILANLGRKDRFFVVSDTQSFCGVCQLSSPCTYYEIASDAPALKIREEEKKKACVRKFILEFHKPQLLMTTGLASVNFTNCLVFPETIQLHQT